MGVLFVESIRRLYKEGKITKDKVLELYKNKKITANEMEYILGDVSNNFV